MNSADLQVLTSNWNSFTTGIDDGAKRLQDTAYGLGYARARQELKPAHDELVASLSTLVMMLNKDKDGSYFLCEEAAGYVDEARAVIAKVGAPWPR